MMWGVVIPGSDGRRWVSFDSSLRFSQKINDGFEKYKKIRPVKKPLKKIIKKDSAKAVNDSVIYEE